MTSDSSSNTEMTEYETRVKRTARRIRHIGYTILVTLGILFVYFLMYSVVHGIQTDQAFDPLTHEPFQGATHASESIDQ